MIPHISPPRRFLARFERFPGVSRSINSILSMRGRRNVTFPPISSIQVASSRQARWSGTRCWAWQIRQPFIFFWRFHGLLLARLERPALPSEGFQCFFFSSDQAGPGLVTVCGDGELLIGLILEASTCSKVSATYLEPLRRSSRSVTWASRAGRIQLFGVARNAPPKSWSCAWRDLAWSRRG